MNAMAVFLFAFILIGIFPILLRAKGANVFMMLCVGMALMELAADEVGVARMILNSALPIDDIAQIFLMLLPATLTLFLTRKAAKKKFPYHIIPSICAGLLAGFWSVSLMSNLGDFKNLRQRITMYRQTHSSFWELELFQPYFYLLPDTKTS